MRDGRGARRRSSCRADVTERLQGTLNLSGGSPRRSRSSTTPRTRQAPLRRVGDRVAARRRQRGALGAADARSRPATSTSRCAAASSSLLGQDFDVLGLRARDGDPRGGDRRRCRPTRRSARRSSRSRASPSSRPTTSTSREPILGSIGAPLSVKQTVLERRAHAARRVRGGGRGDRLADVRHAAARRRHARARARGARLRAPRARARLARRAAGREDRPRGRVLVRGHAADAARPRGVLRGSTGAASPLWLPRSPPGRSRSPRSAWRSAALAREVRAASLLAFLLSLPIAFLALVPARRRGRPALRRHRAPSPPPSRSSRRCTRSTPPSTAAALAGPARAPRGARGRRTALSRASRCGASPEPGGVILAPWPSPPPACAGCAAPARCAASCARPAERRAPDLAAVRRGAGAIGARRSRDARRRPPVDRRTPSRRPARRRARDPRGAAVRHPGRQGRGGLGRLGRRGRRPARHARDQGRAPRPARDPRPVPVRVHEPRPLRRPARRTAQVDNDATLELLARTAVSHAARGRRRDRAERHDGRPRRRDPRRRSTRTASPTTPILAYSAKFASAFYGPFREAAGSTPQRRPPRLPDGSGQRRRGAARGAARRRGGRRHRHGQARAALPRRHPPRQGRARACRWRRTTSAASTR